MSTYLTIKNPTIGRTPETSLITKKVQKYIGISINNIASKIKLSILKAFYSNLHKDKL